MELSVIMLTGKKSFAQHLISTKPLSATISYKALVNWVSFADLLMEKRSCASNYRVNKRRPAYQKRELRQAFYYQYVKNFTLRNMIPMNQNFGSVQQGGLAPGFYPILGNFGEYHLGMPSLAAPLRHPSQQALFVPQGNQRPAMIIKNGRPIPQNTINSGFEQFVGLGHDFTKY